MATALLEKQEIRQPEAAEAETGVVPYHWTVEAFTKASDAGVFGYSERLELVQGRIIKLMGQGPRHATLASEIAEMLRDAAKKQFAIREEKPFRIDFDGEPIPDVMVLSGRQADYDDHQPVPEDVRLLVEVSVTTVEYDLGEKALLYAQAGVTDYWAVLVNESAIVVHREPSLQGYQEVTRLMGTDTLSPLALPSAAWTINELLGRTEASEEN
jgi:Uma2 family endonuclease